ncbi:putative ribonuclease H protein [Glycine soja]
MPPEPKLVSWFSPSQHAVKLKVDGSFIGNPSLSGFGGLLHDSLVQWLGGFVDSCSHSTNMEAEFQAIHKVIWATKLSNVN